MTHSDEDEVVLDGRFRLLEVIGRGASSTVYRAEQRSAGGRHVAVKILERAPGESFEREISVVAGLRHPATIRLIDAGRYGSRRAYLVTELLCGEPLAAVLERGALSETRALLLFTQIAGSLAEAHAHGIVHRCLSAKKVFVERIGGEEHAKVLDFGIPKTNPATAEPLHPGARGDVQALGLLFLRSIAATEARPPSNVLPVLRRMVAPPGDTEEVEVSMEEALAELRAASSRALHC